jgi:hypothetical protein
MTVLYATARDFPSITAFALLVSSVCMLVLLTILRPYSHQRTYYMDLFCYVCLIVQFAFQAIVRASESLGFAVIEANSFRPVLLNAATASQVLRYAFDFIRTSISVLTRCFWQVRAFRGLRVADISESNMACAVEAWPCPRAFRA